MGFKDTGSHGIVLQLIFCYSCKDYFKSEKMIDGPDKMQCNIKLLLI